MILIDGHAAGQVIHTYPDATAWCVAKPLEPIPYTPSVLSGDWHIPEPTTYRIAEWGISLPTRNHGEPAYFGRRIGWSEGAEPDAAAMRRHVRAALLEHPDLMPPGAILWPADPADDEPIQVVAAGRGPGRECADIMQQNPVAMEIRGTCPCGWRTEYVPTRRYAELLELTGAHVEAALPYADLAALAAILGEANRRDDDSGGATRYLLHAAAEGRPQSQVRLSPQAEPVLDWGDPLTESDADWPSQGGTCAHVCGGDPDHQCDARAATSLKYELPSGGTRSMPTCGPCYTSETAAKENVDA